MINKTISLDELMSDLKNKIYKPVYFFTGDEPYYIDKVTDYIMCNVLTEAEKSFNQTVIYGKDNEAADVLNAARRFPMMSNQQVVVLKEAQELKNFENLIHYIENPLKSTILVINYKYKSLDKRKKIYKSIEQNAVVFESEKFYNDKIPTWIANYLNKKNFKIEPKAAVLLSEFLGNDLSKIANELEKLIITSGDNSHVINSQFIEKNIGISKEYNNFELQNAISRKDILKANRIINYFAGNQKNNHITQTITNLFYFFSKVLVLHSIKDKSRKNVAAILKINLFFVGEYEIAAKSYPVGKVVQIISLLREYDVKSKGFGNVSASAGDLLKELIFKILH
jgi:DNA polymerase III subunit delta